MITQLAAPCWVASWAGDTRDDTKASYGGHYTDPGKITGFEGFTEAQNACFHKACDGIVVFGFDGYCTKCQDENVSEDDWEIREIVPRQLPGPCWEADCDAPDCGYSLGDDDDEASHYATEAAAARAAVENLWTVAENETLCGWCNGEHEERFAAAMARDALRDAPGSEEG